MEKTLAIIKPDVVKEKKIGEIISILEKHFTIKEMIMTTLSKSEAEEFYKEHKGKDFFNSLIEFMTSGPIVVIVLEGPNATQKLRELVGDTDPQKAKQDTIRKKYGKNLPENAIHASDSQSSAEREIKFFFKKTT